MDEHVECSKVKVALRNKTANYFQKVRKYVSQYLPLGSNKKCGISA